MNGFQRFQVWYAAQPRALRTLVAINVVVYLLWQVVFIHIGPARAFVWNHLALNPSLPDILFEPWQLITYAFLHLQPGMGGLLHLGFNMLWLWWIGKDLEELQGPHALTAMYIYGGLGGALFTVLLHGAFPGSPLFSGVVHGASGSVLGVMAALAVLYPYKSIGLFLIGVVKLQHVVMGLLAMDILFLAAGGTSISAHFGGAAAGLAFAKLQQMGTSTSGWARVFFDGRGGSRGSRGRGGYGGGSRSGGSAMEKMEGWLASRGKSSSKGGNGAGRAGGAGVVKARIIRLDGSTREDVQAEPAPDTAAQDTAAQDIDKILDKISERGYDALSPEEKKILYEASGK
jgi:membrane associated rhomboid family serine protease